MRRLFAVAAFLLALPCQAADWDDQVVLMSPNASSCTFWQLSRASDFSRNTITLDWDLLDQLAQETAGQPGTSLAVALDQWDPAKGTPTGEAKHYGSAAYCTIAIRAPAAPKPAGKSKKKAKAAEPGASGGSIAEIACHRRDGAGRSSFVFGRSSQQAKRDGMVRYSHACTAGCEQAPFPRIHELSIDDGPGNPAHEKDLDAFYKACARR